MVNNEASRKISTIAMVQVALMAAVIYVATAVFNFPVGIINKGVVHLGDSMVFVAALFLGKRKSAVAAAIGMCLFDLFSPYAIWAPFTFVIKGLMAYIAASIAYRKNYNGENVINNIFAFIVAGIWMIAAYYFSGVLLNHVYFGLPVYQAFITQLPNIQGDIAQVIVGIIIAIPFGGLLLKANIKKIINRN